MSPRDCWLIGFADVVVNPQDGWSGTIPVITMVMGFAKGSTHPMGFELRQAMQRQNERGRQLRRPPGFSVQFRLTTVSDLMCPPGSQRVPLNRNFRPRALEVIVRHFLCKFFTR
jgi:hypothetical protein